MGGTASAEPFRNATGRWTKAKKEREEQAAQSDNDWWKGLAYRYENKKKKNSVEVRGGEANVKGGKVIRRGVRGETVNLTLNPHRGGPFSTQRDWMGRKKN